MTNMRYYLFGYQATTKLISRGEKEGVEQILYAVRNNHLIQFMVHAKKDDGVPAEISPEYQSRKWRGIMEISEESYNTLRNHQPSIEDIEKMREAKPERSEQKELFGYPNTSGRSFAKTKGWDDWESRPRMKAPDFTMKKKEDESQLYKDSEEAKSKAEELLKASKFNK